MYAILDIQSHKLLTTNQLNPLGIDSLDRCVLVFMDRKSAERGLAQAIDRDGGLPEWFGVVPLKYVPETR